MKNLTHKINVRYLLSENATFRLGSRLRSDVYGKSCEASLKLLVFDDNLSRYIEVIKI